MKVAVYDLSTGEIAWTIETDSYAAAAQAAQVGAGRGVAVMPEGATGNTHYVPAGDAIPRPSLAVPASQVLSVSEVWSITGMPIGTEILVDGDAVGTLDSPVLTLRFDYGAVYQVEIRPPFPWLVAKCQVTVS